MGIGGDTTLRALGDKGQGQASRPQEHPEHRQVGALRVEGPVQGPSTGSSFGLGSSSVQPAHPTPRAIPA